MRILNTILVGAPLGLAVGLVAWLSAGGYSAQADKLAPAEMRLAELRPAPRRLSRVPPLQLADLVGSPIFAMTVGPGAVTEPIVRLLGVSVSPHRKAALLAIGDAGADWMVLGESRDGVSLQQITGSKVVVETIVGVKEIALADPVIPPVAGPLAPPPRPVALAPPPPASTTAAPPVSAGVPRPVRGAAPAAGRAPSQFRRPLPPASAPSP